MQDPLRDAQADRAEAARLEWDARHSEDVNVSKDLTRAANALSDEADTLKNEATTAEEEQE